MKTTIVQVPMTDELRAQLKWLADGRQMSSPAVVRGLIIDAVKSASEHEKAEGDG